MTQRYLYSLRLAILDAPRPYYISSLKLPSLVI
jgi:hypothetical protein